MENNKILNPSRRLKYYSFWKNVKEGLTIFEFIRPYKWAFIGGVLMLFISSALFMVFPYLIGLMVDASQGEAEYDLSMTQVGIALVIILGIQGVGSYFRVLFFAYVSENGVGAIRKALHLKILSLPVSFFEENKMGDLISRLTADVQKLYGIFNWSLAEFLRQLFTLLVGIFFLFMETPRLSMVLILFAPVAILVSHFFGKYIRILSKERQAKLAISNAIIGESIQGIKAVKSFTNEIYETRNYNRSISDVVVIAMQFAKARAVFATLIVTSLFGVLFLIIWQGAVMVNTGELSAGKLVSFITYTFIVGGAITSIGNFYSEILGSIGATERVRKILQLKNELDLIAKPNINKLSIKGNISFKNVWFHYPTRMEIPVLKGINFKVKAGQKVAIIGASGAGKSTIIQLLLKFYNIDAGTIKIDGQNIYDFDIRDLRNKMALVPQEVLLFSGTIRENIAYGKSDASEKEIIYAAKKANCWEYIQSFPNGMDTIVGEKGMKLSGGQRQRLAIARAILKDPVILLLDEATSSLDAESERVVQNSLNTLMEGRTSIIIAHRLSTVKNVDCIYVMDKGRIVEKGTHENLAGKENGKYRELTLLQFDIN